MKHAGVSTFHPEIYARLHSNPKRCADLLVLDSPLPENKLKYYIDETTELKVPAVVLCKQGRDDAKMTQERHLNPLSLSPMILR